MSTFENKIALVTGASGGIGGAIATALAREGCMIVLVARTPSKLDAIATRLGARAFACPADISVDQDVDRIIDQVQTRFGRLDILVHSAGAIAHEKLTTAPVEALDRQFAANVRGPYRLTQGLIPMLKQPRGQIIFINSSTALSVSAAAGQYSMMQHAIKAMADGLRQHLNASGIRVTSLYLGRTATPLIEALSAVEGRTYQPELLLQPDDIARVVVNTLGMPWTAEVTDVQIRPMKKSY